MRNRHAFTVSSIGLVALLAIAGCGSDGESTADPIDADAEADVSADPSPEEVVENDDADAGSEQSTGGDPSSSNADFCAEVRALEEDETSEDVTQRDVDQLRGLAERAPDQIADDLRVIADAFEEIVELGDTDDFEAVFSIFLSEEVVEAGIALEEFGVEECGLEPADAQDDSIEFSELDGLTGDEFIPDVSGVESPLYNDFLEPPVDPGVASLDGLKAHLDLEYTDAEWRRNLDWFAVDGDSWEVGWSFGLSMNEQALDICEAVGSYLAALQPDATIVISEFNDGTFEYDTVAEGVASGPCERV